MTAFLQAAFSKGLILFIGALIGSVGFFSARIVNNMDSNAQHTMIRLTQIQENIKQIEVSIASINARMVTPDQVRLIATEVADLKIKQEILTHVRHAHEGK